MANPDFSEWLPRARPSDHKYSRGVLAVVAGSERYPGAALLTVGAALQCRIGMIEYLGPQAVAELLLLKYPEVVLGSTRANALVLGPGVSPDAAGQRLEIERVLAESRLPAVVDAGGLEVLATLRLEGRLTGGTRLLTPHRAEAERLAKALGVFDPGSMTNAELARRLSELTESVVLLKGSVTQLASPAGLVASSGPAPSELAVAGSGDVLAGVLGAMLALRAVSSESLEEREFLDLALTGLALHAAAAELATRRGEHGASALVAAIGLLLSETEAAS